MLIGLYYIIPKRFQWQLLLISSFVFYYFSGWSNLLYISVTIVSTYFVSIKLNGLTKKQKAYLKENRDLSREEKKVYKEKIKSKRWGWLLLCLIFNLGILAVIKYTNFALSNINSILTLFKMNEISYVNLLLPMGFILQPIHVLIIDVREKYEPESMSKCVFIFFPVDSDISTLMI